MKFSDALKAFFKKNGRFVIAGGLFATLILIVVFALGKGQGKKEKTEVNPDLVSQSVAEPFEVDSDQKIRDLILSYYNYYAAGDTTSLERITKNLSDSEKDFVAMFSQYVESYDNLVCYVKGGMDDKSWIVNAAIDIHFSGMNTLAPGLDFFYVETDENGSLYINNLYCQYNNLTNEQDTDPEISKMIEQYEAQPDVVALREEVESKYEEAVNSDSALGNLIATDIHDAYATWADAVRAAKEAANAPAETETEPEGSLVNMKLVTTDRVNVRSAPGEDGEVLATVDAGTEVTLISDMGNGWLNVDYNGTSAFIKAEFLKGTEEAGAPAEGQEGQETGEGGETGEAAAPEETPAETTTGGPEPGSTVEISSAASGVNVRAGMSTDSERIGQVYEGESVKIIDNYAEGWTKVEWDGNVGYIKTDLLQ